MLFLYRPRETWMPFYIPRRDPNQAAYYGQLQSQFESTRRVPPPNPAIGPGDVTTQLRELDELHASGALSDAEFAAAKGRVLGP
jgi:hypothetical protein